jgi:hypothetical protein
MDDDRDELGFAIKDKRVLSENHETGGESTNIKKNEQSRPVDDDDFDYPQITFPNFVLSLNTSAFFNFGDFPDPVSGKSQKDLRAAKQTIDLLDMINEKTKGNLDVQEKNLIQGVLYELKMRYIKEKG